MNSIQEAREAMLLGLEGGQYQSREIIRDNSTLSYTDYLDIGLALKGCMQNPLLHDELVARLKPHAALIIGALPSGIQGHGLLPSSEQLATPDTQPLKLSEISDDQLRQWLVQDSSLIYGELSREELQDYFAELSSLFTPGDHFMDLGSGLGKVVMSAALHFPFATCKGIEIVPYRHDLARDRFLNMLKAGEKLFDQPADALQQQSGDPVPLPWTSGLRVSHLLDLPERVSFESGDMFACNISAANVVFVYSTCFGSLMHKIAHKLANEAPEGCLVTNTTFPINHPGLELVTSFPSDTLFWTTLFVYRRTGSGPWPEPPDQSTQRSNLVQWELDARKLLKELVAD